jgi:hypothetical protein
VFVNIDARYFVHSVTEKLPKSARGASASSVSSVDNKGVYPSHLYPVVGFYRKVGFQSCTSVPEVAIGDASSSGIHLMSFDGTTGDRGVTATEFGTLPLLSGFENSLRKFFQGEFRRADGRAG